MQHGSFAPLAVFFNFKFLALLLFINRRRVIAPLALRASKANNIGHLNHPSSKNYGADSRTRTGDPILTMDVLYLLS